jgi:hypothetical protein
MVIRLNCGRIKRRDLFVPEFFYPESIDIYLF